jgi:hypothetical protein
LVKSPNLKSILGGQSDTCPNPLLDTKRMARKQNVNFLIDLSGIGSEPKFIQLLQTSAQVLDRW